MIADAAEPAGQMVERANRVARAAFGPAHLTELHRIGAQVREGFARFGSAMAPTFRDATRAIEAFGRAYARIAEAEYLRHHARLPGSTRTARGRKKRRDRVARWFSARRPPPNRSRAMRKLLSALAGNWRDHPGLRGAPGSPILSPEQQEAVVRLARTTLFSPDELAHVAWYYGLAPEQLAHAADLAASHNLTLPSIAGACFDDPRTGEKSLGSRTPEPPARP